MNKTYTHSNFQQRSIEHSTQQQKTSEYNSNFQQRSNEQIKQHKSKSINNTNFAINLPKNDPFNLGLPRNNNEQYMPKNDSYNMKNEINNSKNEQESKNTMTSNNFRREKNNDFNLLNKDVIKSRQFEFSTTKDYGYSTNKELGFESSVKNSNVEVNEYLMRSKEKLENPPKTEKTSKNSLTEIQQQQYELYQNNKRDIESLKNDQMTLQEKYYKLEMNFFDLEEVKPFFIFILYKIHNFVNKYMHNYIKINNTLLI